MKKLRLSRENQNRNAIFKQQLGLHNGDGQLWQGRRAFCQNFICSLHFQDLFISGKANFHLILIIIFRVENLKWCNCLTLLGGLQHPPAIEGYMNQSPRLTAPPICTHLNLFGILLPREKTESGPHKAV